MSADLLGEKAMSDQTPLPATDLLYQRDSYLAEFDAVVVAHDEKGGGIYLNQTAFYPTGGGQPCDTGTLKWETGETQVIGVRKQGGAVLHEIPEGADLPDVGATVHGVIEWQTRYRLMRTHTALHALCGTIFRDWGALVTGGNMAPDR